MQFHTPSHSIPPLDSLLNKDQKDENTGPQKVLQQPRVFVCVAFPVSGPIGAGSEDLFRQGGGKAENSVAPANQTKERAKMKSSWNCEGA